MVSSINVKTVFLATIYLLQIKLGTSAPPGGKDDYETMCINAPPKEKYTYDGAKYSCAKLKTETEARNELCIHDEKVALECKQSCGFCCFDNDEYEFKLGDKKYTCSDIAEDNIPEDSIPEDMEGTVCDQLTIDKKTIKNVCPMACGTCMEKVMDHHAEDIESNPPSMSSVDAESKSKSKAKFKSSKSKSKSADESDDPDETSPPTQAPMSTNQPTAVTIGGISSLLDDRAIDDSAGNEMKKFAASATVALVLSMIGF